MKIARSIRPAKLRSPRPMSCAPSCRRSVTSCGVLQPNWRGLLANRRTARAKLCKTAQCSARLLRTENLPHRLQNRSRNKPEKTLRIKIRRSLCDDLEAERTPSVRRQLRMRMTRQTCWRQTWGARNCAFNQDAYGEAGAAGEASAAGLAIVPPLGAIAPLLGAASLPAPGLASAEAAGAELSGAVSSLF